MNIVLIGSGNTATVLGKAFYQSAHKILQVVSRHIAHAAQLAKVVDADAETNLIDINTTADLYIIAATDSAIEDIAAILELKKGVLIHTSGAVSKNVLQTASKNYGIIYPLQSLRKEVSYKPEIPLLIDASDAETLEIIRNAAASISSKILVADDNQRLKLHTAAVIAANFTNHLYALTEDYCQKEQVPFQMLIPLIQETASRLNNFLAKDVQTGPAIRNDTATIQKHLELLKNHPQLQRIYEVITENIIDFYAKQ